MSYPTSSLRCQVVKRCSDLQALFLVERTPSLRNVERKRKHTESSVISQAVCGKEPVPLFFIFQATSDWCFCKRHRMMRWVRWLLAPLSLWCQIPMTVCKCSQFCTYLVSDSNSLQTGTSPWTHLSYQQRNLCLRQSIFQFSGVPACPSLYILLVHRNVHPQKPECWALV